MTNSLTDCTKAIKLLIDQHQYQEGEKAIIDLMYQNPHSAVPHNLFGILLEKEQEHIEAMKHFRAAYALDPAYIPARYNLEQYGGFEVSPFSPAYCEEDCVEICSNNKDTQFTVEYDEHHVGHIVRKLTGGKKNGK